MIGVYYGYRKYDNCGYGRWNIGRCIDGVYK